VYHCTPFRTSEGPIGCGTMSDLASIVELHHYSSEYPPNIFILGTHLDDCDDATQCCKPCDDEGMMKGCAVVCGASGSVSA
jgi:hypothetical protein